MVLPRGHHTPHHCTTQRPQQQPRSPASPLATDGSSSPHGHEPLQRGVARLSLHTPVQPAQCGLDVRLAVPRVDHRLLYTRLPTQLHRPRCSVELFDAGSTHDPRHTTPHHRHRHRHTHRHTHGNTSTGTGTHTEPHTGTKRCVSTNTWTAGRVGWSRGWTHLAAVDAEPAHTAEYTAQHLVAPVHVRVLQLRAVVQHLCDMAPQRVPHAASQVRSLQ